MQCFTKHNKHPRTTFLNEFKAPPPEAYKKRRHFLPDPTRIARRYAPDAYKCTLDVAKMPNLIVNPPNAFHRLEHMDEMLTFIKTTNWTCIPDMDEFGPRRSTYYDSVNYSLQSRIRDSYQYHGIVGETKRHPNPPAAEGIVPGLATIRPYKKAAENRLTVMNYDSPRLEKFRSCNYISVPHYIPDPYPGIQVPNPDKHVAQKLPTSRKMGVVA